MRAGRCLALICHHCSELNEAVKMSDIVSNLTEVIRDNFRNAKIKCAVLPALGEALYAIAIHEDKRSHTISNWNVSALTYTLITRCLREEV